MTLFIPTTQASVKDVAAKLPSTLTITPDGAKLLGAALPFEIRVRWEENPGDGSFGDAFAFGTCTEEHVEAIDEAPGALVLEIPGELHTYRKEIALVAHALHESGALGFRIEQSKAGYAAEDWLALLDRGSVLSLYRLAVVGLGGRTESRTIGMHAFCCADIEIEATGEEASRWLDAFALHQIDADPIFASGHTFAPDAETPRRMMEWWPDAMYPSGHACHNPLGIFRLGSPVEKGRPQPELRMNFIPALLLLLRAAREKKGEALTEEEITNIRDGGVCIAMDWKDVQELERTRGYADLDPERVVECWMTVEESEHAPEASSDEPGEPDLDVN